MLLDVLVADATVMITSSPFFQFTGVGTLLLAPSRVHLSMQALRSRRTAQQSPFE
jgi:hypothetical protein